MVSWATNLQPTGSTSVNLDTIISENLTKFSDLEIISQKLKQKGYYSTLMQNLLKIFKEESEFTLKELEKIANERGEEIDLVE